MFRCCCCWGDTWWGNDEGRKCEDVGGTPEGGGRFRGLTVLLVACRVAALLSVGLLIWLMFSGSRWLGGGRGIVGGALLRLLRCCICWSWLALCCCCCCCCCCKCRFDTDEWFISDIRWPDMLWLLWCTPGLSSSSSPKTIIAYKLLIDSQTYYNVYLKVSWQF